MAKACLLACNLESSDNLPMAKNSKGHQLFVARAVRVSRAQLPQHLNPAIQNRHQTGLQGGAGSHKACDAKTQSTFSVNLHPGGSWFIVMTQTDRQPQQSLLQAPGSHSLGFLIEAQMQS